MTLLSQVQLGLRHSLPYRAEAMLRLLLLILLWLLSVPLPFAHRQGVAFSTAQEMRAVPIVLTRDRFGPLRVVEAWDLQSPNTSFGGFSAMTATADRRFMLFSDTGAVARFRLAEDGAVEGFAIAPLAGLESTSKGDSDIEAVTVDPATGTMWLAFEVVNKIARYTPEAAAREQVARPHAMRRWSRNSGAEAMARLPDGRFMVLSEAARTPRQGMAGVLFARDPVAVGKQPVVLFGYQAWGMGKLTDAALLPDGRVLLLHRQINPWQWFTSTIAIGNPADIVHNESWTARPLASIGQPVLSDNFEALAVLPREGGVSIWILSDDNFIGWQRTVLLHLFLPDGEMPPR